MQQELGFQIFIYIKKNSHLFKNFQNTGAGFWSFLTGIASKSLPYISKYVLPEALNVTSSLLQDKLQNKKFNKQKFKDIAKQSMKNISKKALEDISKGGYKKKKRKFKKIRKNSKNKKIKLKKLHKKRNLKKIEN